MVTALNPASLVALIGDVPDAVLIIEPDGRVRWANRATETVFGHRPDELIGRPYELLIPEDVRSTHHRNHEAFMASPVARQMGHRLDIRALHRDGHTFRVEIALVPMSDESGAVAAIARDVSVRHLLLDRLAATNELLTVALTRGDRRAVLDAAVRLARDRIGGARCWLGLVDDSLESVVVEVAAGPDSEPLVGRRIAVDTAFGSGDVADGPAVDGTATGPRLAVPMSSGTATLGVLALERAPGGRPFQPIEHEALDDFADAIAVTLELVDARAEVGALARMAEHDRIARDLHDTVIQHLFGIMLRVESLVPAAAGVERERLTETVDALDHVIHEIRTTIFNLNETTTGSDVRGAIVQEVDSAADLLPRRPALHFDGPIDTLLPTPVADVVPAVVRELLSNVVRHAGASHVSVEVHLAHGEFCLTVADDGVGPPASPVTGSGLANLTERARALGGTFELTPRPDGGTTAAWRVPVGG